MSRSASGSAMILVLLCTSYELEEKLESPTS
jgi:hypothetical protein